MPSSKRISVQFIGSPDFAKFLKGVAEANPSNLEIVSSREDKDPAHLGLDIGFLWHVLVSVAETYSVLHLGHDMATYLLTSKDKQVIAKTPAREITIKIPPNATQEQIEKIVKAQLAELLKENKH